MTWTLIGWLVIGIAAILLAVLSWGVRINLPSPRRVAFFKRYKAARARAIEQGKSQQVILGNRFWSSAYPGLSLSGLSALPQLITNETLADGKQSVAMAAGALAVIARQIVEGQYAGGFSDQLAMNRIDTSVLGVTPLTLTAGLLTELKLGPSGDLLYLGDYGPEAVLAVKKAADLGGKVFAAAGTLTAQATLFLYVQDLLLGEEVYMLASSLTPTQQSRAGLLVEDLLRMGLILLLIAGAVLKMCGVL